MSCLNGRRRPRRGKKLSDSIDHLQEALDALETLTGAGVLHNVKAAIT